MKTNRSIFTALLVGATLMAGSAFAHEGHDDAPGSLKAKHGGIVKSLDDASVELLTTGKTLKLYPADHGGKAINPKTLNLTATTALPKGTPAPLALTPKADHWEATFDPKGAHRYTLTLTLKDGEHSHKADFTVEPQESE